MITTSSFSQRLGKLGNQIFQVGVLFAIEQRRGHQYFLTRDGEDLWECFDLDVPRTGPGCTSHFGEVNGSCNYDLRVFEQPDGTLFHGYFQCYRYFEGCEQELRRFLRFRLEHRARSEATLFALRRRYRRPLVSVHVRRGDYVSTGNGDHWGDLARDGYYERAVAAIGSDVTYLVFSDDLPWCRESLGIEDAHYVDLDAYASLCMMTGCDINVIANSTFSWWGAYLNQHADVYAPSRWYGPAMTPPNDVQNDILLPSWRKIPVYGDPVGSAGGKVGSRV
jgi:hypothetical protein